MSTPSAARPRTARPIPFPTFRDQVLDLYASPRRSPGTLVKVKRALDLLGRTPGVETTADLTPEAIERAVAIWASAGRRSDATARAYMRTVCRIAARRGHLAADPFEGLPWPKADAARTPTAEEVGRLMDRLRADAYSPAGHRLYVLAATVAFGGLRLCDALALRSADIDPGRRKIRVAGRMDGPMIIDPMNPSEVNIPASLAEILAEWLRQTGSEWAFPASRGPGPIGPGAACRGARVASLSMMGESVGIPWITFPSLRRFWEADQFASGDGRDWGGTSPLPIGQFAREILDRYIRPGLSMVRYKKIKQAVRSILAAEGVATTADLTDDLAGRLIASKDLAPSTGEHFTKTLRTIFKIAYKRGLAPRGSFVAPDRSAAGRPRNLPAAEVERFLAHLAASADSREGRRLHTLAALAAYSGLTRGEVLGLRVAECDLVGGTIRLPGRVGRVAAHRRIVVSIDSRLAPILHAWLAEAGPEWLFPDEGRGQWSLKDRDGLKNKLRSAGQAVGIAGVTFKSLRRSFLDRGERPEPTSPGGVTDDDCPPVPGPAPVVLQGRGLPVLVLGRTKPPLNDPNYTAVEVLLRAWPRRVPLKKLEAPVHRGGAGSGARHNLNVTKGSDPDWGVVLDLDAKGKRGYGIVIPAPTRPSISQYFPPAGARGNACPDGTLALAEPAGSDGVAGEERRGGRHGG